MYKCNGVADYSNNFRYSKIVLIGCPPSFTRESTKTLDLSKAHEAREIYVDRWYHKKSLLLPQSSSLHHVQVAYMEGSLPLPSDHHIRQIIIR